MVDSIISSLSPSQIYHGHGVSLEEDFYSYLRNTTIVSQADLGRAKVAADKAGKLLDQALIELGILTDSRLRKVFLEEFFISQVQLDDFPESSDLWSELKIDFLRRQQVLPVNVDGDLLLLAMVCPLDDKVAKAMGLKFGRAVKRYLIDPVDFGNAIQSISGVEDSDKELSGRPSDSENVDIELLRDSASDAPVIRFVQEMIRSATRIGASDIHLKPRKNGAHLAFRVDGILAEQSPPNHNLLPAVISRLKVLANLDISERRLPQDGRIHATVGGQTIDLRLSTMPQIHGESAVLRILSRDVECTSLEDLGFSERLTQGVEKLLKSPDGLLLVTGPTGSGKSTTLHAALRRLIRPELNIVTIEDPVEYRVDGISQIQVDEKIGLTYPTILRSLLRQDPDIILIGEIRDAETARIAVQAALTGHLVFATIHTNSAIAAIPRLIDMGVEPYLLPAVLRGVLSQRLLRLLCPNCSLAHKGSERRVGLGCGTCFQSGYTGRVAVGELLPLNDELTGAIISDGSFDRLNVKIEQSGFVPISQDALALVQAGRVDEREYQRVVHANR